mmetsp:Transcript_798/g.956  ORF Transcript_798/g.956 Transcript_798/m.956 type:complete len:295 (+) Transcript_798:154-1038(+)
MKINSPDYFINESNATHAGFWEPHTSSIDFCETNYLLSNYVVEVHNALSSLWGIALPGIIGILYGNPTNELRFVITYAILVFIGLGSMALHGTLHWAFQSSDELPMMFLELSVIYCLIEVKSARNQVQYPRLPLYFLILALVDAFVYFQFQQIYIIFLSSFIGIMLVAFWLHARLALQQWKTRNENKTSQVALKFYYWHYLSFIVVAVPIWAVDQLACDRFLAFYNSTPWPLQGCTAHVVWHAMAGMAAHFMAQFVIACRMDSLKMPCEMQWVLGGLIPVVSKTNSMDSRRKQE